jgi:hypothetical protein
MARGGQGSQLATPHIVIDKLAKNGRGGPLTTMCSQLCQKVWGIIYLFMVHINGERTDHHIDS